jgi:hypothetical protein
MFKKRAGARYLKTLKPYERIMAYFMTRRSDAQVFFEDEINCESLDRYIQEKKEQGQDLNYLYIFVAAMVRLYAQRPAMNRFVMIGRLYANEDITICMAVKKSLRDTEVDTDIKLHFTGHENITEIRDRLYKEIYANKGSDTSNGQDDVMSAITSVPHFLIKLVVNVLRLLDRWNLVPKALIEVSPFHCSGFITHMKSLGIPSVYHHIYDFGTVGQFIAMGKEEYKPVVNKRTKNLEVAKMMNIKIVADERICDGLYYAKSFRLFRRIMENPWLLDERLEEVKKDVE